MVIQTYPNQRRKPQRRSVRPSKVGLRLKFPSVAVGTSCKTPKPQESCRNTAHNFLPPNTHPFFSLPFPPKPSSFSLSISSSHLTNMAANTASSQPALKAGDQFAGLAHSEAHYFNRWAFAPNPPYPLQEEQDSWEWTLRKKHCADLLFFWHAVTTIMVGSELEILYLFHRNEY